MFGYSDVVKWFFRGAVSFAFASALNTHAFAGEKEKASASKKEASAEAKEGPDAKGESAPGKKSEVAKKLEQAIVCEAMPQKTESDLWRLSDCFHKMGDAQKTLNTLHEITRRDPKDLEAFFTASWLAWKQGQTAGGDEQRKRSLDALEELQRARVANPTHWQVDNEMGDFYLTRLDRPEKAYAEYLKAREHSDGDYSRNVTKADNGHHAAIEDRIARVAEILDNKGEAVESSCRALFFDPDDLTAEKRIRKLAGSCVRKEVKDPQKSEKEKEKLE